MLVSVRALLRRFPSAGLVLFLVAAPGGCGAHDQGGGVPLDAGDDSPFVPIPFAREPEPGMVTGGQPSEENLRQAADLGFRLVVSLLTADEPGATGEADRVAAVGMGFVWIPVDGADGVTVENAQLLAEALAEPGSRPVILHCTSGNRAGALLAMKAFHFDGASVEEAIDLGRRAGLSGLEPVVRERLVR